MTARNVDGLSGTSVGGDADGAADNDPDPVELAAEIDLLAEENRRLRRQYERARRTQYRRTAVGLVLLGLVAVGGAALFPGSRTVLLALGATGLFAGVLTVYLTPERFIPARVGEQVYTALATNEATMVADLGLAEPRVYAPTGDPDDPVRLFVPQHDRYEVPDGEALADVFVVPADPHRRGVSLVPTGRSLFEEVERAMGAPPGDDPRQLADQLADALVEQFELVDSTRVDAHPADADTADEDTADAHPADAHPADADTADETDGGSRVTVAVSGSAYGDVDRFDHPVVSLLAVGVVRVLGEPVTVEVAPGGDRDDYAVTCRWPVARDGSDPSDAVEGPDRR